MYFCGVQSGIFAGHNEVFVEARHPARGGTESRKGRLRTAVPLPSTHTNKIMIVGLTSMQKPPLAGCVTLKLNGTRRVDACVNQEVVEKAYPALRAQVPFPYDSFVSNKPRRVDVYAKPTP